MFLVALVLLKTVLSHGFVVYQDEPQCLTPDQDKQLKSSIMAIDSSLKLTVTSLNIAAMWQSGLTKEQLTNASRIISAVDTDLVDKMVEITEETCGTCAQITQSVHGIVDDLEKTLSDSVPEWKTNPIFIAVKLAVDGILTIVPNFCQDSQLMAPLKEDCLDANQTKILETSIKAIDATLQLTVTSLNIAAMWKNGTQKEQLELAAKIITAVDTELVQKMDVIVEETCGTCSQITKGVHDIVDDLEATLTKSVPDWKTNPIYISVTTAINGILAVIPAFCPSAITLGHECYPPIRCAARSVMSYY